MLCHGNARENRWSRLKQRCFKNSICKNDFTYLESTKIFCRAFASSDNICYDVKIYNIPKMKQAVKHFLIKRI